MKYMLMMNTPAGGKYEILSWPENAIKNHIAFMKTFNEKLVKNGELATCEALTGPDQAKLVKAGPKGETVTDGVFPETKEFLAGYWIVDVDSPQRAYDLAAQISMAPGKNGEPMHMSLEVRLVMGGAPDPR
jgi:hypothetical protein